MIESFVELLLVGIVLGAGLSAGRNESSTLAFFLVLLFSFCFYIGFLISYNHWIYIGPQHWFIDLLRVILCAVLVISGIIHFLPFYGFFHKRSKHVWLAVSFLAIFVGWHAGLLFEKLAVIVIYITGFILLVFVGRIAGSMFQIKWKRSPIIVHYPFLILLLFSVILLL